MSTPADVLVVGASAAGLSTAEALRRKGYPGRITLLGDESEPPYDRPPLSKQILSGAWEPARARLRTEEQLGALDVEFLRGDPALRLDAAARTVHTAAGRTLGAEAVVLATGLRPRRLPGQDGLRGVHLLRTIEDALALREALTTARQVVVVGDGVLGSETAATCRRRGLDTTLVGLQPAPVTDQFGPRIAAALAGLHTRNGVRVITATGVRELASARGRATGVELASGESLPADVVVVAIGCTPATEWLTGSGLHLDDGVVCDARCRAAPGIYAAGDVARWYHEHLGRHLRLENRTHATAQAGAVAADILGAGTPYRPVPYFWTDQYDAKIQVFGTVAPGARVTVVEGDEGEAAAGGRFLAHYETDGRLEAVLGWNMPKQARTHSRQLSATTTPETTSATTSEGQP